MNLVICNMSNTSDWRRGIVNRNYFVVRELIRSPLVERVLLVDFLAVSSVHKSFGRRRTARYLAELVGSKHGQRLGWRHKISRDSRWNVGDKPVYVLSGLGFPSHLPKDVDLLKKVMLEHGFGPEQTVLWSYNAFVPEFFTIPAALKIFDAVDNWSLHASYKREAARLQQNYARIGQSADLIFTVSDGLKNLFPARKSVWVPNGVDLANFSAQTHIPEDMSRLKRPVIGYVGTVQERLDFTLLQHVCRSHADKSFVFIGPVWGGVQSEVNELVSACPNVHFLGRRRYEDVPAYLSAMDAAIIPHRLDAFISSTNPMKMYDYLAAGKPVVTTSGAGTEQFSGVMHVVNGAEAFSQAIHLALQETGDIWTEKRRQAVLGHTWTARVQAMISEIKKHSPEFAKIKED